MDFIDTHCHIHEPDYQLGAETALANAADAKVSRLICIGVSGEDSEAAVKFADAHAKVYAAVGLHPHDAVLGEDEMERLVELAARPKVVAIGECGLDYFYDNSPRDRQQAALRYQIELALSLDKPMVFHVRQAFEDFWPIFDDYSGIRGVIHSFSDHLPALEAALKRGLYIGLNGIMTFTKDEQQLAAAKAVPLDRLLLETDAPYLTPAPKRGSINEPANVVLTAEFLSRLRGESIETLAEVTTGNAENLFRL